VRGEQADRDHWNNFYKIPQAERDVSDHYPLLVEFELR
jgi:endonuclease/exonuclease/phosphatase (EEP) superfamily protein YafD